MTLHVTCPNCNQVINLSDDLVGKSVRCHTCFQEFTISVSSRGPGAAKVPEKAAPKVSPIQVSLPFSRPSVQGEAGGIGGNPKGQATSPQKPPRELGQVTSLPLTTVGPAESNTTGEILGFPFSVAALWGIGVTGLLVGGFIALMLSAFKPDLGLWGMVKALMWGGGIVVVLLLVRGALGLYLESSRPSPASLLLLGRLRQWLARAILFGIPCVVVWAFLVGAEAFGPPEGFVKRFLVRSEEREKLAVREVEEQKKAAVLAEEQEKKQAEEKKIQVAQAEREAARRAWGGAEFLLVNPAHRALAIRNDGSRHTPKFRVIGKAEDTEAQKQLLLAWDGLIPALGNDPAFARRLYDRYSPKLPGGKGNLPDVLNNEDTQTLYNLARFRPLLPENASIIAFTEGAAKKRRFGYMLKEMGDSFLFCDLVPKLHPFAFQSVEATPPEKLFQTEIVNQTGSVERDVSDRKLRQEADYLDYSLNRLLAVLQAATNATQGFPLRPAIFLDEVQVEYQLQKELLKNLQGEVEKARGELKKELEKLYYEYRSEGRVDVHALWLSFSTHIRDQERELQQRALAADLRSQYEQELRRLKKELRLLTLLAETSQKVHKDLRRILVGVGPGLTVVERSEGARKVYFKFDGKHWLRPKADSEFFDENKHLFDLIQATHILLTEVNKPQEGGTYHLSMRLVEVRTGKIIWAENGDRLLPGYAPISLTSDSLASDERAILTGLWHNANTGYTLKFTEKDNEVRASLASHPDLETFELFGVREDKRVRVSNCYFVLKQDPKRRQFPTRAEMKIIDESHIELATQTYRLTSGGIEFGPMERVVFKKK